MSSTDAPTIAIVDYGMGNRRSVQKALEHVGAKATISSDPAVLGRADGLAVPGVGAFPTAISHLNQLGLIDVLRDQAAEGTPILGICLGMQLLFDSSQELSETEGLGLISGSVRPLAAGTLRLPHIGWTEVRFERDSALTAGLPVGGCPFYHVHSFAPRPADPEVVVGSAEYGERFATIVAQGSVLGVQFHPEKSSSHGLHMLRNFAQLCALRRAAARGTAARA